LFCVDAAIPQQQQTVAELIYQHRPRLFIKGPDWEGRLPEAIHRACQDVGTAIGYVDTPGTHVSQTRVSDEEALARFEQIVQSQQPAEKPWVPVTDYSFEARRAIEGSHPQLIVDTFSPTRVADIGCGPGHLVTLLRELGVNAYGFDKAAPADTDVFGYMDITERDWQPMSAKLYDLVICREVLEHLTIKQIRHAVVNLCKLSSRYVYVTTRFAQHPAHLLSVDTHDGLDLTHISMLSQPFLRALFVLEGFKRRADLEAKLDWLVKGRVLVYERA
jgi:SAM-dependent methyltransferase